MIEPNLHDNINNTYDAHSNTKTKHVHMPSIDVWTIYVHSTNMMNSRNIQVHQSMPPFRYRQTTQT